VFVYDSSDEESSLHDGSELQSVFPSLPVVNLKVQVIKVKVIVLRVGQVWVDNLI
jgi:hypothetical protein